MIARGNKKSEQNNEENVAFYLTNTSSSGNSHLGYFKGFNNCYILVWKSRQTIENSKVFDGVLFTTSCIVLYRFTLGYDL